MVDETDRLARRFEAEGWPMMVFMDTHQPDRPEPPYPPHCIVGTGEEELVGALHGEPVLDGGTVDCALLFDRQELRRSLSMLVLPRPRHPFGPVPPRRSSRPRSLSSASSTADGGPDFTRFGPDVYWLTPDRSVLEIPLACGFSGLFAGAGPRVYPLAQTPFALRLHAPGVAARLRLLDRSRLTPENVSLGELKRITRALTAQGHRVLQFAWHSPSLAPGHTPYVCTEADLEAFLAKLDDYFSFFMQELGGIALTPTEIRDALEPAARAAA